LVTITDTEIKEAIKNKLDKILEFPEARIDNLFEIASIFLTVGVCKGSTSFKLLADHIVVLPSRLKPVILYPYQLTGVVGELKDKYETLVENVKKSLQEIILNSLDNPLITKNR